MPLFVSGIFVMSCLQGCATLGLEETKPVSVQEVVQMSTSGVPAEKIIEKMRKSRTVYRLKASELAELRDKGVSDKVIDYMQQTYLTAVQRDQQLEDMNYWWPWNGYLYGGPYFGWPDYDHLYHDYPY